MTIYVPTKKQKTKLRSSCVFAVSYQHITTCHWNHSVKLIHTYGPLTFVIQWNSIKSLSYPSFGYFIIFLASRKAVVSCRGCNAPLSSKPDYCQLRVIMLHNLIFFGSLGHSSNISPHCYPLFLPTRKSQEGPMDTARWDLCCSSSKRAMIHEAGCPVPGAARNSWHYLLQMGLKMLLARLTKADL